MVPFLFSIWGEESIQWELDWASRNYIRNTLSCMALNAVEMKTKVKAQLHRFYEVLGYPWESKTSFSYPGWVPVKSFKCEMQYLKYPYMHK